MEIGPRAVARAVELRLARLPDEAGALARAAAVLGEDAELERRGRRSRTSTATSPRTRRPGSREGTIVRFDTHARVRPSGRPRGDLRAADPAGAGARTSPRRASAVRATMRRPSGSRPSSCWLRLPATTSRSTALADGGRRFPAPRRPARRGALPPPRDRREARRAGRPVRAATSASAGPSACSAARPRPSRSRRRTTSRRTRSGAPRSRSSSGSRSSTGSASRRRSASSSGDRRARRAAARAPPPARGRAAQRDEHLPAALPDRAAADGAHRRARHRRRRRLAPDQRHPRRTTTRRRLAPCRAGRRARRARAGRRADPLRGQPRLPLRRLRAGARRPLRGGRAVWDRGVGGRQAARLDLGLRDRLDLPRVRRAAHRPAGRGADGCPNGLQACQEYGS